MKENEQEEVDLNTKNGYKNKSEKSGTLFENRIVSLSERKNKPMRQFTMDADWLTTLEAAAYLRILRRNGEPCVHSLRNLVCQGKIPYYKPFGRLLFRRSELQRFIESSRKGGFICR